MKDIKIKIKKICTEYDLLQVEFVSQRKILCDTSKISSLTKKFKEDCKKIIKRLNNLLKNYPSGSSLESNLKNIYIFLENIEEKKED